MTRLLDTFLSSSDDPNLRGELDAAAWRFVLPGEVDAVLWGAGGVATERDLRAIERHARVHRDRSGQSPEGLAGSGVGLLVGRSPELGGAAPLGIRLGEDGSGDDVDSPGQRLLLRYVDDELRGVAPAGDPAALGLLERHIGGDGPVPRSWKRRLRRAPVSVRRTIPGSLHGAPPGPPRWVVDAAAEAGLDVSQSGWALWCRGDFGSQKLVLFLIAAGEREPSIVVKITRDPRFNERLVNETRVLLALDRLGDGARGGAPAPLFDTTTWGSAASAQSAVTGSDLRDQLRVRPDLIEQVTTWMIELADETRTPLQTDEVTGCLDELLARYCRLYDPSADIERFLRRQVASLGDAEMFAVLQHGDPGPWNAVVTPDDRVAFLDWEAGELRGLPLWDLLYFLRSSSLVMSARRPWESRRSRTRRDLIDGSPVGDAIADCVAEYVRAVELDPAVIEPLFHLCWVHRAVKQARRLTSDERSSGGFHRLVLDGIDGRDRPGLRRLTMRTDRGATQHD